MLGEVMGVVVQYCKGISLKEADLGEDLEGLGDGPCSPALHYTGTVPG